VAAPAAAVMSLMRASRYPSRSKTWRALRTSAARVSTPRRLVGAALRAVSDTRAAGAAGELSHPTPSGAAGARTASDSDFAPP